MTEPELRGWRRAERAGERVLAGSVLLAIAAVVIGAIACLAGLGALGW